MTATAHVVSCRLSAVLQLYCRLWCGTTPFGLHSESADAGVEFRQALEHSLHHSIAACCHERESGGRSASWQQRRQKYRDRAAHSSYKARPLTGPFGPHAVPRAPR